MKVMTIVGTRPEVIKMSRVIHELDQVTEHVLVHTGQNSDYELNQVFFDEMGIRPPGHFLGVASDTVAQAIALVIARSDEMFERERPDALVLYGDTNSCLAVIPRNAARSRSSTSRPAIVVSTNACRKNSIARLSTTSAMSTSRCPSTPDATCSPRASGRTRSS